MRSALHYRTKLSKDYTMDTNSVGWIIGLSILLVVSHAGIINLSGLSVFMVYITTLISLDL